ncbi:MAG: sensor histidine kinase, partial [Cryomorphaceae bacterium]
IAVSLVAEKQGYRLSVADSGTGIPEELKERIFMPNFTTKTRGMGLGLAISKNIVEQSGGEIWFESKPDDGTVFHIWLPGITA